MNKFLINGQEKLAGQVAVSGAKNVALKTLVAACLTSEEVVIENIPLISDFFVMAEIIKSFGGKISLKGHTAYIQVSDIKKDKIPLDKATEVRTSSMLIAPLLARAGHALIPNPGGCRIGARPIDRIVKGLQEMGASLVYQSDDGYFHGEVSKFQGTKYCFEKNTHTGTETMILAATLAQGETILENAAAEPEVDELIKLLNAMGAKIKRTAPRTIIIKGVKKLHGARFLIGSDRNEIVTFAIAGILTGGEIFVSGAKKDGLVSFLEKLEEAGGGFKEEEEGIRFFATGKTRPVDIATSYYPGFMTDWQGPWAVLMTQTKGVSIIHETIYENRFGYTRELLKMGAKIELFNPKVSNPDQLYNFNLADDKEEYFHAAKIYGPTMFHNAVVSISDLRAGATLVLASLAARGESIILGVEHLDRGYEAFDKRLQSLGARIKRVSE